MMVYNSICSKTKHFWTRIFNSVIARIKSVLKISWTESALSKKSFFDHGYNLTIVINMSHEVLSSWFIYLMNLDVCLTLCFYPKHLSLTGPRRQIRTQWFFSFGMHFSTVCFNWSEALLSDAFVDWVFCLVHIQCLFSLQKQKQEKNCAETRFVKRQRWCMFVFRTETTFQNNKKVICS